MSFSFRSDLDFCSHLLADSWKEAYCKLKGKKRDRWVGKAQLYWKHTDESSLLFCKYTVVSESNE